jgi:multidrug resistance efflux pump
VSRDEPVAVLRNEDLTRELQKLKQRLALKNDELAAAAGSGRTAEMARVRRERNRLADEEREFRRRVQELVLRAPLDGVVITSRLHDLRGVFLREGDAFCEVADPQSLIARVPVLEYRLEEVAPGQEVHLKLLSYPFRTFPGRVVALAPASGGPVARRGGLTRTEIVDFDAVVHLLEVPEGIRTGMAGTARIRVGRATVAGRTARALRRWYGSRVW